MNVQGSVVLQAIIGSDGIIEDLRVVSGPPSSRSRAAGGARVALQTDLTETVSPSKAKPESPLLHHQSRR